MRSLLLGLAASAAIALPAAPAGAQEFVAQPGFLPGTGVVPNGLNLDGPADFVDGFDRDGRHDGRRHHRRLPRAVVIGGFGWNEGWALYNNRTFESDSYNDWWHDRPDRAYPRWIRNNQNCQRMWWGGEGWRC
jgi:hypothetical protein